jgi:RNA polymerase sigma factor (sigma-70 family)
MDEAEKLAWAIDRIELRLAIACGQLPRTEEAMHRQIARIINDEYGYIADSHGSLWLKVREKYLQEGSVLAPYILADDQRREIEEAEAQRALQPPLPAARAELVFNHLPLIRSLASSVAGQNDTLFSELELLGVAVLEEQARKFDPSRGVTFGAYARHRLRGAMIDYARSHCGCSIAVGGPDEIEAVCRPKPARRPTSEPERSFVERDIRTPSHAKGNDYAAIVLQYLKAGGVVRHSRKQPPADMAAIEDALLKLNRRQQVVYRGRVLADPPLSRAILARQLGIADETQISRIERQAHRKMAKWLKVSP